MLTGYTQPHTCLTRRQITFSLLAGTMLPALLKAQAVDNESLVTIFNSSAKSFLTPFAYASCAQLDIQLTALRAEGSRIASDKLAAGANLRKRFSAEVVHLDASISELAKMSGKADYQKTIAICGAVFGAMLFAAGFVFTSPIAVAALIGVQVIGGATLLGFQLYRTGNDEAPSMFIGYTRDRTLLFGSIAGINAGSPGGRLAGGISNIAGALFSISDAVDAKQTYKDLQSKLEMAKSAAEKMRKVIIQLENADVRWASAAEHLNRAAIDGLSSFIEQNKSAGCRIMLSTGPVVGPGS